MAQQEPLDPSALDVRAKKHMFDTQGIELNSLGAP